MLGNHAGYPAKRAVCPQSTLVRCGIQDIFAQKVKRYDPLAAVAPEASGLPIPSCLSPVTNRAILGPIPTGGTTMRLGVAFWSGVNLDNIDSTLQRLAHIGVKGIGHIAAHDWHPEQLQSCRAAIEAQGCFVGEVTLYHCGWPLASPDPDIRREASESLSHRPRPQSPLRRRQRHCQWSRRRRPVVRRSLAPAGTGHGRSSG